MQASVGLSVRTSTERPQSSNGLPQQGLLAYFRGGIDTIGLSVSDYADIDPALRSLFFSDAETKRDDADILPLAFSSDELNLGTMIGIEGEFLVLYQKDANASILDRALKYAGIYIEALRIDNYILTIDDEQLTIGA